MCFVLQNFNYCIGVNFELATSTLAKMTFLQNEFPVRIFRFVIIATAVRKLEPKTS